MVTPITLFRQPSQLENIERDGANSFLVSVRNWVGAKPVVDLAGGAAVHVRRISRHGNSGKAPRCVVQGAPTVAEATG
jgi:hypothetical protein